MEEETMTKEEQATMLIDRLTDVQRVIHSADREKELENQKKILTAKLEALGVNVSGLPDFS